MLDFTEYFNRYGDDLLKGWLRAREDGNDEEFSFWLLGEYDFYIENEEGENYAVPYMGLADTASKAEAVIFG